MSLRLHFAVRSDVGHVREGNEDSAYAGLRLLAVADGMGGHAAGEVASSTVISRLADLDDAIDSDDLVTELNEAVRDANRQLREMSLENSALDGMGTTVTAVLSSGDMLGVLHVGDSRAYLLRDGVLSQVTHDHTLVQDLVDQGRITPEQANTHPQRSLLMRALDGREVEPDLSVRQAIAGDRYLLCTDGLSGVVSEETILETLLLPTPQEAVDQLVDLALKGGGPDNITVVVADIEEDHGEAEPYPLVAGAAAEKRAVPGASPARSGPNPQYPDHESAAAKAARIGRPGFHRRDRQAQASDRGDDDGDDSDPEGSGGRRSGRRVLFVSTVVFVLIAAGAAAGWTYVRGQYYVGVDDEHVALFQGVKGIPLSSVVLPRRQPLSEVAEPDQAELRRGIRAGSRDDAEKIISRLRTPATPSVRPSPSPSPTDRSKVPSGTSGSSLLSTALCQPATGAGVTVPGCPTTPVPTPSP
ncbi:serine/threonine-protein phosphatase [Frankia sp. B2]|uniref:PP2C family protein-serine/threonine phosphatase n=1 Tax=unclassified Frankia TaxID=2632575 RepID=UPI0003D04757|nr:MULTISPECIES: PP2C family serine/threonine-protein phosphatase [unclassified Frankia]ETA04075.1 serine/threonine protein phosphatase [Frankia sp. CcI6]OHV57458.1 serine/threonine protein phosphatase [Frankia sp. CgIS1]TFE34044.1 serine/threonine-protein phosphatase [Frankia sp. B2]